MIHSSFSRACRLAVILVALGGFDAPAAETIHVFLIGGQSNADGRADSRGLPRGLQAQKDVPYFYAVDDPIAHVATTRGELTTLRMDTSRTGQFGPEIAFGRTMADYYAPAAETVALVKFAAGGTNLATQWTAGGTASRAGDGTIYQSFQSVVTNGIAALRAAHRGASIRVEGMIWMHGEKDAAQGAGAMYQAALEKFIDDIRLIYGGGLPFAVGELSSQIGAGNAAERDLVRAAQAAAVGAVSNAALVNTDAFPLSDGLHFNSKGQLALGRAFATAMQGLLPPLSPSIRSTRFIDMPRRTIRTSATSHEFQGVAPAAAARAVYLVNRRLGAKKYFKAKGVAQWTREIALRPGRNLIVLYALGTDGVRQKIERRVVIRRIPRR